MNPKPGLQTSEFWLTAVSLVATIAHTLGFAAPQSELAHGFSASALAVITAWLGGTYMAGRLQLKAGPDLTRSLQDAFAARLSDAAAGIENRVETRVSRAVSGQAAEVRGQRSDPQPSTLNPQPSTVDRPQPNPAASPAVPAAVPNPPAAAA